MAAHFHDVWLPFMALSPYATVFLLLIAGIWFIPFAEELALVTAGYVYYSGEAYLVPIILVAGTGVFLGDFFLFLLGRRWGSDRLLRPLAFFGSQHWLERVGRWLDRHGAWALFLTRFLPGVRLPAHVLVGAHGMFITTYFRVCLLAVAIYVPLIFTLAYSFGAEIDTALESIKRLGDRAWIVIFLALVIWALIKLCLSRFSLCERKGRRRDRTSATETMPLSLA